MEICDINHHHHHRHPRTPTRPSEWIFSCRRSAELRLISTSMSTSKVYKLRLICICIRMYIYTIVYVCIYMNIDTSLSIHVYIYIYIYIILMMIANAPDEYPRHPNESRRMPKVCRAERDTQISYRPQVYLEYSLWVIDKLYIYIYICVRV